MTTHEKVAIGVIGGSGLYDMPGITDMAPVDMDTPFGKPSAPLMVGTLSGKRVAFVPRHGNGHVYSPTTVPYAANIYALKMLGVRYIISVSACGSLQEQYEPGHVVVADQLYDNTKLTRQRSFFEHGLVAHVSTAHPFDDYPRVLNHDGVHAAGATAHDGGTFITIEGPRFSTKGESNIFRQWGCDIIGMTTSPEAFLATEAEIAYAVLAHITDYDVWHETEAPVTVEAVMATVKHNVEIARGAIAHIVEHIDLTTECPAHTALANALITNPGAIPPDAKRNLSAIVGHYFDEQA